MSAILPPDKIRKALEKQVHLVTQESRLKRFLQDPLKPFYRRVWEGIPRLLKCSLKGKVTTFWGDKMQILVPERSSSYILKFGFWEEDVAFMLVEHLRSGDVFIDIGAHIGFFTLLGSALVGLDGQVHSFEPSPWAFDILQKNMEHKMNCILNPTAVSSVAGTAAFYDYGPRNSLYNSFFPVSPDEPISQVLEANTYNVNTISLDEYCAAWKIVPDLVKIDAETAEEDILRGASRLMEGRKTKFLFEVGGFVRTKESSGLQAAQDLLDRGYSAHEFKDGQIRPYTLKQENHYKNLLFVP